MLPSHKSVGLQLIHCQSVTCLGFRVLNVLEEFSMKRTVWNLATDLCLSGMVAAMVVSWVGLATVRADFRPIVAGTCAVNAAKTACIDESCAANGSTCTFTAAVVGPPAVKANCICP